MLRDGECVRGSFGVGIESLLDGGKSKSGRAVTDIWLGLERFEKRLPPADAAFDWD